MSTTLRVDGIDIPVESMLAFDQDYDQLLQRDIRRTADNSAILRMVGNAKLTTTIRAEGLAPPGLAALDLGSTHEIGCAMPNSVRDAGTSITLPAARRTDSGHTPIAFALVDGRLVETTITGITDNVATLTPVSGETGGYLVWYWPLITAVIINNTATASGAADYGWQIYAEEA
jgi:hypothetical protein